MLVVKNLHTSVKKEPILKGLNLSIKEGEIHAIMGKNGCGKSTLLNTIMGNNIYTVNEGSIILNGTRIETLDANLRANKGLFMTFQNPYEFFEARTVDILTRVWNKSHGTDLDQNDFVKANKNLLEQLEISEDMLVRDFNVGFSGGEKKRLEVLQLLLLKPSIILLDEIDTGLDVDSIIQIGKTLKSYQRVNNTTVIIVTHLSTFLKFLVPDYVHIIGDGKIIKTGTKKLATRITEEGYSFLN